MIYLIINAASIKHRNFELEKNVNVYGIDFALMVLKEKISLGGGNEILLDKLIIVILNDFDIEEKLMDLKKIKIENCYLQQVPEFR